MKVTMKADFSKAIGDINQWKQRKIQRIEDVVNESSINVQSGAKQRCKVDTGRLRSSITILMSLEQRKLGGYRVQVGTKVNYAAYVEFGTGVFAEHPTIPGRKTPWTYKNRKGQFIRTKGSKAQPFLQPAAEEERPQFFSAMRGVLRE